MYATETVPRSVLGKFPNLLERYKKRKYPKYFGLVDPNCPSVHEAVPLLDLQPRIPGR